MKHNKNYHNSRVATLLAAAVLGGLAMTGCEKERGNLLQLVAESHQGDAKTSVSGKTVYWVDGDEVSINGNTLTVSYDGSTTNAATVSVEDQEYNSDLLAIYPADAGTVSASSVTVNLPSANLYAEADGRQQVAFPMVAKGKMEDNGQLRFKHLCAAIEVVVKNSTGYPLMVRSITVESEQSQLSGSRTLSIDWDDFDVAPASTATAADRRVTLALDENDCILAANASKSFQIPVYPIASGDKLTFTVYAGEKKIEGVLVTALYTYKSGDITTSAAIGRAQVAYTPEIAISTSNSKVTKMESKFSVADGRQVYFSQGILQYSLQRGKWSFADHQYKGLGAANMTSTDMIDLFCYGQSNPNAVGSSYTKVSDDVSGTPNDWAREAGITYNGVTKQANKWRSLTWDEWKYLLRRQTGITINEVPNVSYMIANINDNNGLLLFPDGFNPANESSALSQSPDSWAAASINAINYKNSGSLPTYPYQAISLSDWAVLEAAGCVFMVADGWINTQNGTYSHVNPIDGIYWLGTEYEDNADRAYCMYFNASGVPTDHDDSRPEANTVWAKGKMSGTEGQQSNRMAVRMVRDVTVTD